MIEQVITGKDREAKYLRIEEYESNRTNRRADIIVRKTLDMLSQEAKKENKQIEVAFYLRVSTKNKSQEMALKEQQRYMERIEKSNKEWKVSWYIDFGKTGTNTNRKDFQRLMEDAKHKKFSYIIAREVARFARNVSQSLVITDELREIYSIGAYFLFDEIDTLRMQDRSKFIDKAKQSEEEAWRTSKRVHATLDNQIEYDEENRAYGPPRGSASSFGFISDKDNKQHWLLDKEQAETVKEIFSLAEQGMTLKGIKVELEKKRAKNSKGDVIWHYSTISRILRNTIYIGLQYQGKEVILPEGFLEKKRTRTDKKDWILVDVRNYVPVLIAEEQFYKVQHLLESRQNEAFKRERFETLEIEDKDIWSSLLLCACGSSYRRDGGNGKMAIYRCYNQINYGSLASRQRQGLDTTGACGMKSIAQWKLQLMLEKVVNLLISDKEFILDKAIAVFNQYSVEDKDSLSEKELDKLKRELKKCKSRKKVLTDSFVEGYMDEQEYKGALKETKKIMDNLEYKIKQLEIQNSTVNVSEQTTSIKNVLSELLNNKEYNRALIYNLVDLVVHKEDNRYLWFLNFASVQEEQNIADKDKMVFIKKAGLSTKRIVKSRATFLTSFTIDDTDARNYKYNHSLGYVKRWKDIEVEVYL